MGGMGQGMRSGLGGCVLAIAIGAIGLALTSSTVDASAAGSGLDASSTTPIAGADVRARLADGRWIELDAKGSAIKVLDRSVSPARLTRTVYLPAQRQAASLTAMPDGRVLIWGGVDARGRLMPAALWFDPATQTLTSDNTLAIGQRAGHSATVLTDGRLLLTGGWARGKGVPAAEAWDARTNSSQIIAWTTPRTNHRATLQANGDVRISGGMDAGGQPVERDSAFVTASSVFAEAPRLAARDAEPAIGGSLPQQHARDVSPDARLALRFNQPMRVRELNSSSVTLFGPGGRTQVDVVPVENGRLMFVKPRQQLLPDADYTVLVDGVFSESGRPLPLVAIDFHTAALSPDGTETGQNGESESPIRITTGADAAGVPCRGAERAGPCRSRDRIEDGAWTPGRNNTESRWRIYAGGEEYASNPGMARVAARHGVTVVRGRVVRVDQQPVANVDVSIGNISTRTNDDGWFLLFDVPAGRQELYVDGTTANRGDLEYGQFVVGVDVKKNRLTELPFLMHLPRIMPRDKVRVSSPLAQDVVLTHPDMPGLQVTIPVGTIIRDRKGRLVTELALVPTPVNRAPFPVADNYPMYFTVEPGGAVIQGLTREAAKGVRVAYPNYDGHAPGTAANFWIYDPQEGWRVYGQGRVGDDGMRFEPEEGVALHQTMGGSYTVPTNDPPPEPDQPNCNEGCGSSGSGSGAVAGDPIDLMTGSFLHSDTDIAINDLMPIGLGRTYRQHDLYKRSFGIGTASNYDYMLHTPAGTSYSEMWLVLPNGTYVPFVRLSGSGGSGSWRQNGSTTGFDGATLQNASDSQWGHGYWLTLRTGQRMYFGSAIYNSGKSPLRGLEDRNGNRIDLVFEAGLLKKVVSPSGRSITLTHDSGNRIASATDPIGRTWRYEYETGLLKRVIYPDQTAQVFTYDTSTDPVAVVNPERVIRHIITSVTNRRGIRELQNHYPGLTPTGGSLKIDRQTLADGSELTIDYLHDDGDGKGILVTQPDGSKRRVKLAEGRRYPVSDTIGYGTPLAQTTQFERAAGSDKISARIDAMGRRTEYQYNGLGQVTQTTYLAGTTDARTMRMGYTTEGDLASVTDPLNRTTTLSYINRCLTRIKDPLNRVTDIACNSNGQPVSVTDPLGNTTWFHYDGPELTAVVDPLGRATGFAYDMLGRLVVVRDSQGRISRREYDNNGRMAKLIDPEGNVTELGYDANGNATAVLLAHGNGVTYTYDERDRVTERRDALDQPESWTYDALDRVLTYTDRKQQVTQYTYDALGRPDVTTFADGSTQTASYDIGNRLLQLVDSSAGTLSWQYDVYDQLLQEVSAQGTVAYQYDAVGRRSTMTAGSQPTVEYRYDEADQLKRILQGNEVVEFEYDDLGRRTALTLPNGVKAAYTYDAASQLTGMAYVKADASVLGDLGYGYDSAGLRVSQAGTFASELLPAASTGNAFDDNNRQTQYQGNALSYDANGNLTSDGQRIYIWNARDQLVGIQQGGLTIASFEYDAMGRRKLRAEGGQAVQYLYDGEDAVQETRDAAIIGSLMGLGIDERFARDSQGGRTYFANDALGSARALTSSSGSIVQRYDYTPYGQTQAMTGALDNPYRYTGREMDQSGLYYYRARYYHPGMARFMSEDPLGFGGGDWNPYAYVYNNPLMYTDPLGLWAWGDPLPQWMVDYSAGFGDTVSFGLTNGIRELMDTNGAVNKCSGAYSAGEWSGVALGMAAGGAAGWRSATKKAGTEFSHWIPNRMNGPRSLWNGNFVTPARHYFHDPYRYVRGWRDLGPKWPAWLRQMDRIPNVYKGGALGGAAAGASAAAQGCSCG